MRRCEFPGYQDEQLAKRYGRAAAADSASFAIAGGAVCDLFGRDETGKTTALAIALGPLLPVSNRTGMFGVDMLRQRCQVRARTGTSLRERGKLDSHA